MKNNSFLSSEEIVKSFLSYLDDSIYSYAYLLDGSWGSGKTFFVKEILIPSIVKHEKEKKNQDSEYKEKRILYVSLYGIKETEEISRLLYLELRKVMADKMTTGRFLKKHTPQIPTWLGTTSKIVSDVIKDSKGIDIENIINKISTGFSLKNCIFIFDDLERTSCNVNDILGYINNFIEHDQVKVLLIANEAEINTASRLDVDPEELLVCLQDNLDFGFLESEENSGYNGSQSTTRSEKQKISLQKLMKRVEVVFARNQAYKQIKEKVVGETVKYQPEYLKMITNLIERNLNNDEKLREILLNKANKIEEIAEYYEHFNLRTFLFFLSKVVTLYDCLQQHVETFEKMIDYIFLISVKYKTGKEIEQWEEPKLFELRSLYGWFDFRNQGGLITLDSIPPVMIYRIPASYKAGIRDELDKEEKINVCSIYPDMPSGGAYLRAKYRTVRYEVSEKDYTVYDISQKTHCRRDTDLRIIVKEDLPIKWAKQIVRHVCEGYKSSSDVIWIYVGVSKEDMLLYNWRITGRWINPLWKNTGIDPLKERDGEFSWENQSGTSIISEYNEENVYKPDDELYVYYHQIFEDSMPYIREMFSLYANDEKEKLYTWISENKEQIQEFYNKTTNGCCSRIREWNEFIKHYSLLYIELNNICLVIENRNWNPQAKWHLVGRKIHSIQKEKDVIEKGEVKWRKTLDVTDEELKKYKPCYENHQVRSFTQTIPVSEDAIEVRMEIKYEKNTEGKIIVSGKTNLFDGAQLLISITPDGKFYGPSCKVNCLNGTFTSVPLGNGTNLSGKCRLSITMPVSSVQPIEFVKKAGMQYENLKGDFIVRDGISPSGKYEQEVIL